MYRKNKARIIELTCAFLSALAGWIIATREYFSSISTAIADTLGITNNGKIYSILSTVSIPAIFVFLTWLFLFIYENIIWPKFPWLGCKSGWYVYGLISERALPNGISEKFVVGYFLLNDGPHESNISQGEAYYPDESYYRGSWFGNICWDGEDRFICKFEMNASGNLPEAAKPHKYEGLLSLKKIKGFNLIFPDETTESWDGNFHDLGDRFDVSGYIYAERLKSALTGDDAKKLALDDINNGKIRSRISRKVVSNR
jgi:hypothetical protein